MKRTQNLALYLLLTGLATISGAQEFTGIWSSVLGTGPESAFHVILTSGGIIKIDNAQAFAGAGGLPVDFVHWVFSRNNTFINEFYTHLDSGEIGAVGFSTQMQQSFDIQMSLRPWQNGDYIITWVDDPGGYTALVVTAHAEGIFASGFETGDASEWEFSAGGI